MIKLPKKESATVEFKSTFNEEAVGSLVAFSNAQGGYLAKLSYFIVSSR